MTTPRFCAECKKRTFHAYCVGEDSGTAAWVYTCVRCGTQHSSEIRADDPFDASALRGQEGRLRPGSEAAGKVHGAPLSGLDAATIEACAREVGFEFHKAGCATCVNGENKCIFGLALYRSENRIRALATPPGQATP